MIIRKNENIKIFQFSHFNNNNNEITHFITTRHGGKSTGNYASMNLGEYCEGNLSDVSINREIFCNSLGISTKKLFVPYQIHGDKIGLLDHSFLLLSEQEQKSHIHGSDALITTEAGICIAVTTADCVPILLYSPENKIIAVIHAGWKGTVLQIVAKTVRYMNEHFNCNPKLIKAGIGPAIGIDAFEVGEEVVDSFISSGLNIKSLIKRNSITGKSHIDLWKANQQQLIAVGVEDKNIEIAGICTYSNNNDFFSARRLGIHSGRILSGIMLNEKKV